MNLYDRVCSVGSILMLQLSRQQLIGVLISFDIDSKTAAALATACPTASTDTQMCSYQLLCTKVCLRVDINGSGFGCVCLPGACVFYARLACRTRVPPASSHASLALLGQSAHVACVPRLRLRQS